MFLSLARSLALAATLWAMTPKPCPDGLGLLADDPYAPVPGTFDPVRSDRNKDSYLVETGLGTRIVRHVPKDPAKPAYATKEYDDLFKFIGEQFGYRLLEELYGPGSEESADAFRVMRVELASVPRLLFLPDLRGKSLPKVLADPAVDPAIRRKLVAAYERGLADLDRRVKARKPTVREEDTQDGLPMLRFTVQRNDQTVQLSIRASQVVVTFTPGDPTDFVLTLADPR
jgi:hypothetical protein